MLNITQFDREWAYMIADGVVPDAEVLQIKLDYESWVEEMEKELEINDCY